MGSNVVRQTLDYIEANIKKESLSPVYTFNALGSHPLAYRTFGGQKQGDGHMDDKIMETAFGSHYLLTLIASSVIIREMLYPEEESCHSLYCDGMLYQFLDRHGMVEHGAWDRVNHKTLDDNINMENIDHRIYYSSSKPDALMAEAARACEKSIPILFVDADLILKKRHDAILQNPGTIRAAYGHLEAPILPCYPDFTGLHFPEGYQLPKDLNTELPAVNTCLMYFNDMELAAEWGTFFKELFLNNWLPQEPDAVTISQQLLGIDQRTFPMIAERHGYWNTSQVEPFLDITWYPPCFYDKTGQKTEWHYYTLEYHPEHTDWLQDITHTWINKRNIERDTAYRNYQGCMMLEMILELCPGIERYLGSFDSIKPYFHLLKEYGTIEHMLSCGAVRDKLDKDV